MQGHDRQWSARDFASVLRHPCLLARALPAILDDAAEICFEASEVQRASREPNALMRVVSCERRMPWQALYLLLNYVKIVPIIALLYD